MVGLAARLLPYALAFFSSLCIMILELVSSRLVARHVGSSLTVWTSVIGIILGGICLGNVLGGRLADRVEPRRAVGPLFALGSLLVLGCLWINAEVGHIIPAPETINWELRTVIVVILDFLVPATVLGMVGPVVAKMAVEQAQRTGSAIGDVYFCGAIGSIAGTFLAGFVLMYLAPSSTIVLLVAAALALLAAALFGQVGGLVLGLLTALLLGLGSIDPLVRSLGLGAIALGSYQINFLALAGNVTALLLGLLGLSSLFAARRQYPALGEKTNESVGAIDPDRAAAQPVRPGDPGVSGQPWLHGSGDGGRADGVAPPGVEHLRLDQRHRRSACRIEPGQLPGRTRRQPDQERKAGKLAVPGRVGPRPQHPAAGVAAPMAARSIQPGSSQECAQRGDHAGPS